MASKFPVASITLRTRDINQVAYDEDNKYPLEPSAGMKANEVGVITQNRNVFTFRNVPIRQIIGDALWNKYDNFIFQLINYTTFVTSGAYNFSDAASDLTYQVYISGLNFKGCYTSTRKSTGRPLLCIATIDDGTTAQSRDYTDNKLTFAKMNGEDGRYDLTFECTDILSDAYVPKSTVDTYAMPDSEFTFLIYPAADSSVLAKRRID